MKEFYINNQGYVMRYHDFPGTDIPILFIHGLGCAGSFDYPNVAVLDSLKKHRRIIVDLLGAGYSDKPEDFTYTVEGHAEYLVKLINYLSLDTFILFGHSLGGAIALSLADKCENRLHQIILSESNLDKSVEGSTSKHVAGYELNDFISYGFNKLVKESRENGNAMWAATLSNWFPTAVYQLSKSAAGGGNPSWRSILYALKCHKTFIFGENSLPDLDLEVLAQHDIQIEIVEEAGHSMAWENPIGLAEAINRGIQAAR